MNVLVTGAAGFIGSVVTDFLIAEGHSVTGLDDLRYGHESAVHPDAKFVKCDINDAPLVESTIAEGNFDAVVHLAAEAYIDESVTNPGRFYAVNVQGGINLLESMRNHGVNRMIFSSTAAIFGEPTMPLVSEDHPKVPVNAYGDTKLAFERALYWYHRSFGLRHVSFRYFNASGATERNGEDRRKETHLIPILFQVVQGRREKLTLFGDDYPTPDGTCIRDYVHVADIARAHLLGLAKIDDLGEAAFNLGSGKGNSNLEVIETARAVTGHAIPFQIGSRRIGDPGILVATHEKAEAVLGWKPQFTDIKEIVQSSWNWRLANPNGYKA